MVILAIVAVIILGEATSSNARRDCVDVGDNACVCARHIKVELHIPT
jgi:hypothetical protein